MDDAAIQEMFAGLGEVTVKRLFSGKGIYHNGLIVGAAMDGEILLKSDAETDAEFAAAGATRWVYQYPDGRTIKMPYWTMPADALDDIDERALWVRRSYAVARRSEVDKQKTKPRKRSK